METNGTEDWIRYSSVQAGMLRLTGRRPTPEANDDNRSLHRRLPATIPGLSLGSESRGEHQARWMNVRGYKPTIGSRCGW